MFKFAINNKSEKFSLIFKKYRNILTRVKELSKRLYYQQAVNDSSGNSKKLWKAINNIITYKLPKNNQIEDNNSIITRDPFQISNILNENFVSIADKLSQERLKTVIMVIKINALMGSPYVILSLLNQSLWLI